METQDFLQMRGIFKSYDGTQALRGVDFTAALGEVHAIVGENGAGKSTLVRILAGAVHKDSGHILLGGHAVEIDSPIRARRLGIRAVHQEFSLVPQLTVTENILLGQLPTRGAPFWIDWPAAHERAQSILDHIGFTGIDVRAPVAHLSVSHQQMVEIAKAVAESPRVLILDEPSAVLSQEELRRLFALIRSLKERPTLILYISHRLDEVFEIADRITVLKDGQLVGTVRPKEVDQNQLIRMMIGRSLEEIYPARQVSIGRPIFTVHNLRQEGVFRDVSFSLSAGEVVGLFGLVGSGRTQLARCLFGAEPITGGQVYLDGKPFHPRSPRDAVNAGVALLTEDRKRDGLVMECSIRDNASLAILHRLSRWGVLDRAEQDAQVRAQVRELDVRPPQITRLVRQLSGGNQQKVVLAKWLLTRARVLILDEPTRGVDVGTKVEIYRIINDLAQQGVAILLISSELPEVLGMSDRVLVMREGQIVGEFSRTQATEESVLACAAGVQ
jgi:ABC-type sugar transport system ATPase subunit